MPLHPRLARMLVEAGGAREMVQVCALLSERHFIPARTASTSSDLLSALDDWRNMPVHVQRVASEIERRTSVVSGFSRTVDRDSVVSVPGSVSEKQEHAPSRPASPAKDSHNSKIVARAARLPGARSPLPGRAPGRIDEREFRRAILAGYPDRVAQRRAPGSSFVRLGSGTGAVISEESGVRDGEFLVALEVQAPTRNLEFRIRNSEFATRITHSEFQIPNSELKRSGAVSPIRPARPPTSRTRRPATAAEARIRLASRVEREWLKPTGSDVFHRFDKATGSVRAVRVERYDALILSEQPAPIDADVAAHLLAAAWMERGAGPDDERLLRRLRFAGRAIDLEAIVQVAAHGARSLHGIHVDRGLPADVRRALDRDAPETIAVPSGRRARLEYQDDGTVMASVKLQELFGLAETPRIGPRREPVLLALLAPNGQPVQLTRDLRSFWDRTYPEVRKELRGRYPKHPWPDDPWKR
jgi:ATP-dependent helicase HrpB